MIEELKKSFDDLSLNQKRNQLNVEIIVISEIIKQMGIRLGIDANINIENYNINKDLKLLEEEYLTKIYQDVYAIERELITIFEAIDLKIENK